VNLESLEQLVEDNTLILRDLVDGAAELTQ
jgi:hypothetical protein